MFTHLCTVVSTHLASFASRRNPRRRRRPRRPRRMRHVLGGAVNKARAVLIEETGSVTAEYAIATMAANVRIRHN